MIITAGSFMSCMHFGDASSRSFAGVWSNSWNQHGLFLLYQLHRGTILCQLPPSHLNRHWQQPFYSMYNSITWKSSFLTKQRIKRQSAPWTRAAYWSSLIPCTFAIDPNQLWTYSYHQSTVVYVAASLDHFISHVLLVWYRQQSTRHVYAHWT